MDTLTVAPDLVSVVGALGSVEFGPALGRYVESLSAVDYCCTYRVGRRALVSVSLSRPDDAAAREHVWTYVDGELWRHDPALMKGRALMQQTTHVAVHMAPAEVTDSALRSNVYPALVDRLLICDQGDNGFFSMSLLRWYPSAPFTAAELARVTAQAPMLMALVGKHAEIVALQQDQRDAMDSLEATERCFADMCAMPLRERQVCARIVFGHATSMICSDLNVGAETVKSYRRRAYNRLGVNDERELLLTYFRLWARWRLQRMS